MTVNSNYKSDISKQMCSLKRLENKVCTSTSTFFDQVQSIRVSRFSLKVMQFSTIHIFYADHQEQKKNSWKLLGAVALLYKREKIQSRPLATALTVVDHV